MTEQVDAKTVAELNAYKDVVARTCAMVGSCSVQKLAARHGLQVLNVTWEDTGRFKGSAVGPNISDMTIQVQQLNPKTGQYELSCMPVIRFPNFADVTADIAPDKFFLLTGNEKGRSLRKISLREFLMAPRTYMSKPESWKGHRNSLYAAERDTHMLISAQACFLPIPKNGDATFNPVLFNYQSYEGDPAVLTVLATREGTSITVIDNKRDGFDAGTSWGQRLFFNQNGERASLTGKRMSDCAAGNSDAGIDAEATATAAREGMNMVLLVQVPLKQKRPMSFAAAGCAGEVMGQCLDFCLSSDVEEAVIGHGKVEGPFIEVDNLAIERDPKYPVRVTVQFYKATSNGVVSEKDLADISSQIKRVYDEADYVGSLVVQGDTGRPTEYDGPKFEPPDWWDQFWKRHQQNTGMTPQEAIVMLRNLYGPRYRPANEDALLRDIRWGSK